MRRRLVRPLVKPFFLLMLMVFIYWTMLTVWNVFSNSNVGLESQTKYSLKNYEPDPTGPCKDCSDSITEKAVEPNSHSLKKNEDNFSNNNTDKVAESDSHSLKKQEDNLKKPSDITDKVVEHDSHSLKKHKHRKKKSSNSNTDKVKEAERDSNSLKKQEDNLKKSSDITDTVVEHDSHSLKKQKHKKKKSSNTGKVAERDSNSLKKQEDNLKKSRSKKQKDNEKTSSVVIDEVMERYSLSWKKQEDNSKNFRSLLSNKCSGITKAIITQANTPVGSQIMYDGEKKRKPYVVTPEAFEVFPKDHPFLNKKLDTCAVIGNGGILVNSSCGESINSAQFVFRCNLSPLSNVYVEHVGNKTNLVTANLGIFNHKFMGLKERRRPFLEWMSTYGDSYLLLPAFTHGFCTALSLRALYTLQEFGSPNKPIFLNSEYLQCLVEFWRSQGLKEARLSTGFIMVNLALEVCTNVHLYGFWPFSEHPHGHQPLTNHYYDNMPYRRSVHAMPAEFEQLLNLHNQGVLKIHLGKCLPDTKQTL